MSARKGERNNLLCVGREREREREREITFCVWKMRERNNILCVKIQ